MGARAALGLATRRDPEALALKTAEALSELRGLSAKIGQMAGYLEGVLPEGSEAAFEGALSKLRTQTRHSPIEGVRAILEEELGAETASLFAEFEDVPFASASIGQVHRARLEDGRAVAVKIQHPGVAEALRADLDNVGLVSAFTSMLGTSRAGTREMIAVARERFAAELDYTQEAAHQERVRALYERDARIVIPEIIASHSSARVLTSLLMEGVHLDDPASRALPLQARTAHAQDVFRFTTQTWLEHGLIWADPHTGNVLLAPDGRTIFLDFGCMQRVPAEALVHFRALHLARARGDEPGFRQALRLALAQKPGRFDDVLAKVVAASLMMLDADEVHVTQEAVRRFSAETIELKKKSLGALRDARPLPGYFAFAVRLLVGRLAMLAYLDAPARYRETLQR